MLEALLAGPLLAAGGCCASRYPQPVGTLAGLRQPRPLLFPEATGSRAPRASLVVDVHAHFFNASDVPVRGFVEHCLGHSAPKVGRLFLKAAGEIAERLARLAPPAEQELRELRQIVETTASLSREAARSRIGPRLDRERDEAARRTVEAIRGSDFERLFRSIKRGQGPTPRNPALPNVSKDEVLDIVREAEAPSGPTGRAAARSASAQTDGDTADGMLSFLKYMLSARWANLEAYKHAFTEHENSFGIDRVLGSLVDFDYWLECPPVSAHEDQVLIHKLLQDLYAPYFRGVVAYNPWTDMNQDGACLARVVHAVTEFNFAAVKIYPPTGFQPSGNVTKPPKTKLPRPDLRRLDDTLAAFFAKCAELRIPVIAHTSRSNGRDDAHDEFGGPAAWEGVFAAHAATAGTPSVNFGHFGGGAGVNWTQAFAAMMARHPGSSLYGDLGYWDELVCHVEAQDDACRAGRDRLRAATAVPVGEAETVMDRTMFATDWLMLSQVKRWADYPAKVYESVRTFASEREADQVFGGNAVKCFGLSSP